MGRVVITGLGFITSIGNNRRDVASSLQAGRTGVERFAEFADPSIPVKLAGTVKGFEFPSTDFEDWTYPPGYKIPRETLRPMAPNSLFAYFAMRQAIDDAGLAPEDVSNPLTGLMCASGGSMMMAYASLDIMLHRGVQRCPPMSIINSIPGSLYINLVPAFRIKGPSAGFSSACSSSAHALGAAVDLIRSGRQKTVFVCGAEDCSKFTILPFAAVRALSVQTDPGKSPCAFDKKRDGFVGTGGAAVLVVEDLDSALERGAPQIRAEILGWGQASDGYNVLASDPTGDGLARTMELAMTDAGVTPEQIEYINAHATSTPFGDASEANAIKKVFSGAHRPYVSSTKSLTGHGLSLAGAMEAGLCCLTLEEGFVPVSANITELDPVCAGVNIVTSPVDVAPRIVMNNSSGFGGTNVSIVFRRWEEQLLRKGEI
jgi:3-oxoacyl-[acyl-carrier-protein] synthase-1